MDATANDIPPSAGFKITGFPSIRLRPAGKDEWIEYSADRSLESFECVRRFLTLCSLAQGVHRRQRIQRRPTDHARLDRRRAGRPRRSRLGDRAR